MVGVKGNKITRGVAGEIVQVQGGHVIRATGGKDRHSKVFTAKGPRDRRVRLSAHTAIQFYDVQDRLGYDRPSKAVDWLIKMAKDSIDKLAELPPWAPPPVGEDFPNYPQEDQRQHLSLSLNANHINESGGSMRFDGGWVDPSPSNHHDLVRFSSASPFPLVLPQVAYNFQRGTLQSSNLFSNPTVQSSVSGFGFGSEVGFMGFSIPTQIHDVIHHHHHEFHGGSASVSNTNASSSSLSPADSSTQH